MNLQHNKPLRRVLLLLSWLGAWAVGLGGVLPLASSLFRETWSLPFITADMFSEFFVGLTVGVVQWFSMKLMIRRALNHWLWMSTIGAVLGALIGGGVNVYLGLLTPFTLDAFPLPFVFGFVGVMQASALWGYVLNPWRWMTVHLVGALILQTALPGLFSVLLVVALLSWGNRDLLKQLRGKARYTPLGSLRYDVARQRLGDQTAISTSHDDLVPRDIRLQSSTQHVHQAQ